MKSVKIGFAPTRRSIFSAPDAVKYANLTRERLKELGVEFVDITDINEEGLFYDEADREKIQEKFRRENVKGIFFPHGNFGTEYVCARLAKEMAQALTHLLAVDGNHIVVHPVMNHLVALRSHSLCNLALVVRENQIHAATMNIEVAAQVLASHRSTLAVPARETIAPRTRPAHDVLR